jgi:hypothetical protein
VGTHDILCFGHFFGDKEAEIQAAEMLQQKVAA